MACGDPRSGGFLLHEQLDAARWRDPASILLRSITESAAVSALDLEAPPGFSSLPDEPEKRRIRSVMRVTFSAWRARR
jgi:hypothetical protein